MKSSAARGSSRRKWLRWLGTALSVGTLIYLLASQGWQEIGQAIAKLPLWRVGLALLLMLGSRFAVALRWHVLLRSAQVPIPFERTLRLTFSGLFASNVLPTTVGGDVFRLAGAIQAKLDAATVAASLIADRLIGMAGMAMALPFGLPAWAALRRELQSGSSGMSPHFFFSIAVMNRALIGLITKGMLFIGKVFQTLRLWQDRRCALLTALGWTWVHMLCLFGSLALLLKGLGEPLALWEIGGLWSFVYFVTLVPISINGYGLQEVSFTLIFSTVGGISQATGLTVALLIRLLTMIASLPGALFVPAILSGEAISDLRERAVRL
ncbi:MAG: lysylphosphatidylglycerol synthase transmembrane domain-containing protein [Anaerolineales bacterium]|nr:flippase-like domain-containing protein [Anaerolineales bacterium]MDW8448234.1 lysylphosphatidylglycerol synthase transmembrane domain-containing protein [Anaerolineales bacterium]